MVGSEIERGFVSFLIVAILLVSSLLIPALVRITDAIFYQSSQLKAEHFMQAAFDAKYVFVKYFYDHPESVYDSDATSCGKIYVPPDKNPASFIISRDEWGRAVSYQKWDLRTETTPESGLIIRFVSAGPDGKIDTGKSDPCSNTDICYEIFNCEMDSLVTAYSVRNGT